ncbi:MAG: hypothetical protein PQJ61_12755 [Spirochaetales bacterium]|uniref:Twin-arginine translocase subunit TatB n=1 Tax=Candidatus Thalassospirochaeta sargassi TaxID=3119039 RepID=A0AAJ1MKE8_9SPIO|nr:hypothetical protein [Spirochaetales bacterium]
MFGFGFSEIITILVVVIVLINPKELPSIVRKIGKMYGKIMRQINHLKKVYDEFEEEVKFASDLKSSGDDKLQINNTINFKEKIK